jgi:hypothetical protein
MATNDRFRANFGRKVAKAKTKQTLFFQKLLVEINGRVVIKSPVDTGRFRANWVVGNGSPDKTTTEATDGSGAATIARAAAEINSIVINGQIIYVTNSLPYGPRLEYEGWSKQAPAGMVRVTLAELGGIVRGVAREVRYS